MEKKKKRKLVDDIGGMIAFVIFYAFIGAMILGVI